MTLSTPEPMVTASPDEIFPPNHKLVPVQLTAMTAAGTPATVTITGVSSSEADGGLGAGDHPNDIRSISGASVLLRAERFSKAGRTYTVTVRVGGNGQVTFETGTVVVAHSRGNAAR